MKLFEILDTPETWRVAHVDKTSYLAEFEIDGVKYEFTASSEDEEDGYFILEFLGKVPGKSPHGITDTGNAIIVFATIYDIVKDFVKKLNPLGIEFSAKEASRIKLYNRFARKLASQGYDLEISKESGEVVYRLTS